MRLVDKVKHLLGSKEAEYWNLFECKIQPNGCMTAKMHAADFDRHAIEGEHAIPILDGVQYTFLVTPAYPIVIERVSDDYVPKKGKEKKHNHSS